MPGMNAELLKKLQDSKFWTKDEIARNELLNNLLNVDSDDAEAFRATVAKKADQWDFVAQAVIDAWIKANTSSWPFTTAPKVEDYYKSKDFLDPDGTPSFFELQLEAATQRVKFNLNKVIDPEVLLNILRYNEAECRAYLAEKIDPELVNAKEWVQTVEPEPAPDGTPSLNTNDSVNVLDKDSIETIKEYAAARWVLQQIAKADHATLEKLASNQKSEFRNALETLGFPKASSAYVQQDLIWATVESDVTRRLGEFRPIAAMAAYTQYVENFDLSDKTNFAATADHLKLSDKPFRDGFPEIEQHKKNLTPGDLVKLKENLGARFLDKAVAQLPQADILSLLKQDNLKAFQAALGVIFPGHDYIDKVVTQEKMAEFKAVIAPKAIPAIKDEIEAKAKAVIAASDDKTHQKLREPIVALSLANNLKDFQGKLSALLDSKSELQKAIPHLNTQDMADIQKVVRKQRFEIQVQYFAGKAGVATSIPKLHQYFDSLDSEKQLQLLAKSPDTNATFIKHLLSAQSVDVLQHYLPDAPEAVLKEILVENQNNQRLKNIFNPAIAKVLAGLNVELNEQQLAAINTYLAGSFVKNFADETEYKALIAKIQGIVNPKNLQEFHRAFGLSDDGKTVDAIEVGQAISEQHEHNKPLFVAYRDYKTHSINPKLIELLLTVEKTQKVAEADSPAKIKDKIDQAFRLSTTPEIFINDVAKDDPNLLARLTSELTENVYQGIKNDIRKNAFKEFAPGALQPYLTQAQNALDNHRKNHNIFAKFHEKVKFVPEIKDIHIHNPVFQSKQAEMRQHYEEISEECDVLLDQLRQNYSVLQGYLDSTEMTTSAQNNSEFKKLKKKVDAFRDELAKEMQRVKDELKFYSEVREAISGSDGILDKIDQAPSQRFIYQASSEVKVYLVAKTDADKKIQKNPDADDSTIVDDVGDAPVSKFVLGARPKADEELRFDMVHKVSQNGKPPVEFESRFVYDTANKTSGAKTSHGKADSGKFTIQKFPTAETGVDPKALEEARVRFAMTMATQILAFRDKPPTKDNPLRIRGMNVEEVKYLWTALAILGENMPNMKFKTDALVVACPSFKLSEEKGWRYTSKSLYNNQFKEYRDTHSIQEMMKDAKEQSGERFDKSQAEIEKNAKAATKFFKSELSEPRKETEERQKKQGVAPDPSALKSGPAPS